MTLLLLPFVAALVPGLPAFAGAERLFLASRSKEKEEKDPFVIIETDKGNIKLKVFRSEVPATADNFLELVDKGFYDGLTFHRYVPNFVIQGGDPTGTGVGGSDKEIPLEHAQKLHHSEAGMVGMAHKRSDVNSATSQFYIILSPRSELDKDYCVFARVEDGLDIIFQLRKGDKMNKVYIEGKDSKKK